MSRITITDVRRAGHCARGAKDWFARHGMDFRAFLKEGIDEAEFLEKGDALALQVVNHKRLREMQGGQ